jgi:hypothetical protein
MYPSSSSNINWWPDALCLHSNPASNLQIIVKQIPAYIF